MIKNFITMWNFICTAMILIALAGCHTNKNMSKTENTVVTTDYTLPQELPVSASFRMFWEAWQADLAQSGQAIDDYTPSTLLVQRFSLRNQNGEYLATGFLHTDAEFDADALTQLGGYCVKYNETMYSFAVPLRSLTRFVALPGITYIEASSPARPR